MRKSLLLDFQVVVNEGVWRHDPNLCLYLAADGVNVSHADRLQHANDASLMDSFETSPCNAENHLREDFGEKRGGVKGRDGVQGDSREEMDLGVRRVLRSLEIQPSHQSGKHSEHKIDGA